MIKFLYNTLICIILIVMPLYAGEDHKEYFESSFSTPQEVTKACLECHDQAANDVMKTVHWTWESIPFPSKDNQDTLYLGKKNTINNFCIALESNWPRCTSCHAGYGWKNASFDFKKEENVDCLVCHDQTGTYKKSPAAAGLSAEGTDLLNIAQNVGPSTRVNCGSCHFYGGGGENVKHGDLDQGLVDPSDQYDIHMGNGMTCQDCHTTENHSIKGRSMAIVTDTVNRVFCTDCHESTVHEKETLNKHSVKIACQTCHIPVYAKERPTKIYWDWSTAGQDKAVEKDIYGMPNYDKKKGDFKWDIKIKPEYYWYNENSERYIKGQKLDPDKVLALNKPLGNLKDNNSKLYPFKVMRGRQIYDTEYHYLVIPQLWEGYWMHFDWNKASEDGMKAAGLEYSGKYGWIETEMYWKLNHMVSPKEDALKCTDCHGKGDNRRIDWERLGYKGDQQLKKNRD
ncbi:MAG: tetrathionate reductase family octaheme c-type cytochrome [Calditrichaceae bacterium]|nr:tetrathionate reductase family octaheme c-type cytochrome [Calditrichaceae bacterium]